MNIDDDFHAKIPTVLKKIRESQLAGRFYEDGALEYFVCGSPFDSKREEQNWGDKSFVKTYELERCILRAFQDIGIIRNGGARGYCLKGRNFKFELIQPNFDNFCELHKKDRVYFEMQNGKYILKGAKLTSKQVGDKPKEVKDLEDEDIYFKKAGKYSYSNLDKVYHNGEEFKARHKLCLIIKILIDKYPVVVTEKTIRAELPKKVTLQSLRKDINEINNKSARQFHHSFIGHSYGKEQPYMLNH